MIPYLVLDIENDSSKESKDKGRKAGSPWFDKIVAIGFKGYDSHIQSIYNDSCDFLFGPLNNYKLLVGHNLSHDLLFLWKKEALQDWFKNGGRIWDTALAEYLITGHEHKYPALRDLAVNKYGCNEREKLMEKYWDEGRQTSEIPKELVLKDVENDVLDTEQIFLQQYKKVIELSLLNFIELQMDALCASIEMSWNGIFVDQITLKTNKAALEQEWKELTIDLLFKIQQYWWI